MPNASSAPTMKLRNKAFHSVYANVLHILSVYCIDTLQSTTFLMPRKKSRIFRRCSEVSTAVPKVEDWPMREEIRASNVCSTGSGTWVGWDR